MSQSQNNAERHLDDLTLQLVADAEPVPAGATAHLTTCGDCEARLAALRAEDRLLTAALALDADELQFLREAALPQRATASCVQIDVPALDRSSVNSLLLLVSACAVTFAGWIAAAPIFAVWWDYARRLGVTTVLANAIAGALYHLVTQLAAAGRVLASLAVLEVSLVMLASLAAFTWLALVVAQLRTPQRVPM